MTRRRARATERRRTALAVGIALLVTAQAHAAQLSLSVHANRSRIYLGESVQVQVRVDGTNARDLDIRFPSLQDADLELLGTQDNSSRSIQIINGRVSRQVTLARTYVYRLTPRSAGRLTVGTIELESGGQHAAARGPVIDVTGIDQRPDIQVAIESTRQTVLVDEPFSISLCIRIAGLPTPNETAEPLHPRAPPHLQADFLQIEEINGLQPPDLKALLEGMITQGGRAPAFRINNYQSEGFGGGFFNLGFGSPFEPQPFHFRFPVKRVEHNGKAFWEYRITLDYTARNEGDYTFGPVTFKGEIITGADERGQAMLEEVFTVGSAVTIRVVPPPEAGRPETFIGTVGRGLRAKATLDTSVCKVGDPLILTLEITGAVSLSNLRPPLLDLLPAEDFRIYAEPHESETLPDGKRFRYRIRPLRAGTLEFPAIPISYFDTDKMQYATVHTVPLPIQAHATTEIAAGDGGETSPSSTQALTASAKRPDGILAAPIAGLDARGLAPTAPRVLRALLAPPACFLLAILLRTLWRRRHSWRLRLRCRRAHARACRGLRRALRLGVADPVAAASLGAQTLRTYFAERLLDAAAASVTAAELNHLLHRQGLPPETTVPFLAGFAELEQLPFRPLAATPERVGDLLRQLSAGLTAIDRRLARGTPAGPHGRSAGAAIILLFLLPAAVLARHPFPDAFTWERANQAMAGAQDADAYLAAARIYNELILAGSATGPLFHNLGTALLLAGDARNAEAALLRAERHLGAAPEVRTNLRLAIGARTGQPDAPLPPSRVLLAWHYQLPLDLRIWLTLAGWCLFWAGLTLRLATPAPLPHHPVPRRRTFAHLLAGLGVTLLVVYGGSTTFTLLQEQHDSRFWPERTLAPGGAPQPLEDSP